MPVIDLHLSRLGVFFTPKKKLICINNTASRFIEQMERRGIIYCLHCISTGEKYIGQTRRSLSERLSCHRSDAKKIKNKKSNRKAKLYIQVNKTGWGDFIFGIIDEFDIESLNEKECFYIEKYDTLNNGLNTVPGGGFFPSFSGEDHPLYGVGHTEETKKKISRNHHDVSGKKNPNYGKTWSEEWKQKRREKSLLNPIHKGTFWWNNGIIEIRSKDNPGDGFVKGRIRKFKNKKQNES